MYPTLIQDHDPQTWACITADGKRYSRSKLLELINKGSETWNKFKRSLPPIRWYRTKTGARWTSGFLLHLKGADLRRVDFSGFDLTGCDFPESNFTRAIFSGTNFSEGPHGSFERNGSYRGSVFRGTKFQGTHLSGNDLSECDFTNAELNGVSFHDVNLAGSRLNKCLIAGRFTGVNVERTDFASAYLFSSSFINMDLSGARNLTHAQFLEHVTLDHRTLFQSGPLPDIFYRGCGLPEIFVEYMPSLTAIPLQFETCFISHSSKDEAFAARLYKDLQEAKVRCFYAPKDLRIGSIIRDSVESAIHLNDRLLLVLSKHSISSQWVEHEVEAALERERSENRPLLFPIMIDGAVMTTAKGWAANLRRQRHIGDFRQWANQSAYREGLQKLLSDLQVPA